MRRGQQALREVAVPVAVGRRAQVEAGKVQQVEAHQHDGGLALRGGYFRGGLQLCAVLQGVERRASRRVECHDLAIENHLACRLCREIARELGKEGSEVQATA